MSTLTQLTPNLWVTQSTLFATNSGIFVDGDRALLIDPGIPPQTVADIARFVADRATAVQAIVLTHAHWDHILGPAQFPGVSVIVQARYLDVLDAHGKDLKRQVADWASQNWIRREHPLRPAGAHVCLRQGIDADVGGFALAPHPRARSYTRSMRDLSRGERYTLGCRYAH